MTKEDAVAVAEKKLAALEKKLATRKRTPSRRIVAWVKRTRARFDRLKFHHEPALRVTDAQLSEIAASLGVEEGSEHIAAVLDTIRRYHGRQTAMGTLPHGNHRDHDIETLLALARAMDGLNANVLARLAHFGVDLGGVESANIADAARHAAEELQRAKPKPKRGPKRNESRDILFRELADIYSAATGRRPTISRTTWSEATKGGRPSGPFPLFIRAAIAPLPDLARLQEYALASAVERALQTHK